MIDMLRDFLRTASQYPDVIAVILGTAAGYALGILAETYLIPLTMSKRQQQGLTVLTNVVASFVLSYAIWGALDSADNARLRAWVSIAAALLSVFTYPTIGRIATKYFPSVQSIWSVKE